ncbi:MAG: alpha/beta fold hydrolase [Pararhodobacter sp.]|nr:alpha/beta fold hydrolase [Pararhodobacter sp.]
MQGNIIRHWGVRVPIAQINGHQMYYEVHGSGPPAVVMGGWGSYCHGNHHHIPKGLTDRYSVLIFDHRGLCSSDDEPERAPTMALYAQDVAELLDHLGMHSAHVVGLVGMGACIAQELAIRYPAKVRSMVNMNTWAKPDALMTHQLQMLRDVHRQMGWAAFQKLVCLWSFDEDFYLENHARLLGPVGPWRELDGRYEAHARLIDACLSHDTTDRLHLIRAPTLIIHCPLDLVNGPRLTRPIEAAIPGARGLVLDGAAHVVAGRAMRARFAEAVHGFLKDVEAAEAA